MSEKKDIAVKEERNVKLRPVIPAVDIYENDDEFLIHADMPGVVKEKVTVNIDNGTLSLSGVRRLESRGNSTWEEFTDVEYARRFSVPQTIDVEKVEAELKNGVLKLHLPKSPAARPKMIEIKAA